MKLTHRQLDDGINLLGRSILALEPNHVNSVLAGEMALAEESRRRGRALVDVWLKVQTGSRQHFIWIGKGEGNYVQELPANVDPAHVVTIQIDPSFQPANILLNQLMTIVDALSVHPSFNDSKANISLELAEPRTDQPEVIRLKPKLARLRAACAKDYNTKTVTMLTDPLRNSIVTSIQKKNIADAKYQMQRLKKEGVNLRDSLAADCLLASWLKIYPDICDLVIKRCEILGLDEKNTQAQWIRYVGSGCGPGADNPIALTCGMIDKGVREGLGELMNDLAQTYCDKGEELVEKALSANSINAWGDALYGAVVEFFLGNRIYGGLVKCHESVETIKLERYKKSENHAEEQQTLVASALVFGLKNRDGSGLAQHRAQIIDMRKTGGELAVETMLGDLIERQYFYPRYFHPILKSQDAP